MRCIMMQPIFFVIFINKRRLLLVIIDRFALNKAQWFLEMCSWLSMTGQKTNKDRSKIWRGASFGTSPYLCVSKTRWLTVNQQNSFVQYTYFGKGCYAYNEKQKPYLGDLAWGSVMLMFSMLKGHGIKIGELMLKTHPNKIHNYSHHPRTERPK